MERNKLYQKKEFFDYREMLHYAAETYNNKIAFRLKKNGNYQDISYIDFKRDVEALGAGLLKLGLENKRVAIISPNRYEWCVSYLAITTANMIVVPLDKSLPENEIESSIIRSKVEAVIFDAKYKAVFQKLKEEKTSNLQYYICMDEEKEYDQLIKEGKEKKEIYQNIKIDNKKMSIMLFTSGTTSMSKIVMLSQFNICSNINAIRSIIELKTSDTLLSFLPLHHTFECTTTFLTGISCGIKIVFCDGLKHIASNLKEYEVTGFVCVPLMLETMYKKIQKGIKESGKENLVNFMIKISNVLLKFHVDLRKKLFKSILNKVGGHIRMVVSGAAAINPEVVKGFNNLGIVTLQGYGLTETSPVLCAENDKYRRPGSSGFPLYNVELQIDHPDEKGIGEIKAKGPNIMLGYYENEEATKEVLKDGWFYTGDLGYIDKDGYVYVKGRKKTVIVLKNGKNIYPEEVESLVNELDYVAESMIFGRKRREDDLELVCKIVYQKEALKEAGIPEEKYHEIFWEEIKKINKTMPPYKYIRDIILTEEPLIKTTTQKIKRYEEMKRTV